ncbi:MAG TPA: metalloregulator ArsR/SmtB family transcription factor [Acidimicrobiales bacterium]|nr:metalloregulator ArsR/SmtB family transcription factor [Acidimicrobiales bacterium]
MDDPIRALAAPKRRAILELIANEELSAGEIAEHFDVTRPAVSQHLTVLKSAGLIAERRDGTKRLYRIEPEGISELRQFVENLWSSARDTARRLVEEDHRDRRVSHGGTS